MENIRITGDTDSCIICFEENVNQRLVGNCMHIICEICFLKIIHCPLCRNPKFGSDQQKINGSFGYPINFYIQSQRSEMR